jgi:hypothetical protein
MAVPPMIEFRLETLPGAPVQSRHDPGPRQRRFLPRPVRTMADLFWNASLVCGKLGCAPQPRSGGRNQPAFSNAGLSEHTPSAPPGRLNGFRGIHHATKGPSTVPLGRNRLLRPKPAFKNAGYFHRFLWNQKGGKHDWRFENAYNSRI